MKDIYAAMEKLADKAMAEYQLIPAGRATMYYRATTPQVDGDVIVRHPDDDVDLGFEIALLLSAAWPYDLTKRNILNALKRLPILPMSLVA